MLPTIFCASGPVGMVEQDLLRSVQIHLAQLLNTRQGSLAYLPDYGLPDLGDIYQALPQSISTLVKIIEKVIHKYEPRILNLCVLSHAVQTTEHILELNLRLTLISQAHCCLKTHFLSNGRAKIEEHRL